MLLTGKQFKILNRKLISSLQLQADAGGKNFVYGIEVDVLLKGHKHRLQHSIDLVDQNNEKRVKAHSDLFTYELKVLKDVAMERYVLFIQDVKKVSEDVNLKIEELHEDMGKEVAKLNHNYSSLH
ncbi:unnamed protein product [Lactuca saligna]|uniref:Uncharacterized protein n=1 Tax=Lactuca saligna TaxID=75948 RepID=A0AA35YKN9_LACSI|nr:unnamed protein product [Lactuca saligna]